jgi:mono/diheme cytochrome c family protein
MNRALSTMLFATILVACQPGDKPGSEYMPDMAHGPAYKAFAPNLVTRNGITMQRPVAGTIARGRQPFHYEKGDAEAMRAGRELTNPFHPTPQILEKGKVLYQTYCLVCHGEEGKGDGPIASKIPPPPSYKSDRLLAYPPGRIFHVITRGANKMPSYAAQLSPEDRWLIITYVRAQLQGLPEAPPGTGMGSELGTDTGAAPAPGAAPTPGAPSAPGSTPAPAPGAAPPPASGGAPAPGATPAPASGAKPASGSTPAPGAAPASGSAPTPAPGAAPASGSTSPPASSPPSGSTPAPKPASGSTSPPAAGSTPAPASGSGDRP